MKAWAMKSAAMHFARSTRVKAYFGTFNSWVPCTVQPRFHDGKGLKQGMVYAEFHGPVRWDIFRLQLPIDTIKVEHKLFKHWVPLSALEEVLAVLRKHDQQSQAWYWTEKWQEGERHAAEDYAAGRYKHFDSVEELIADLNAPELLITEQYPSRETQAYTGEDTARRDSFDAANG